MKITVNYDTVTKKLEVMENGVKTNNLDCLCFHYLYYDNEDQDKFTMEMRQMEENKDDKIRKMTSTIAKILCPNYED